ncbi:GMC oxidoreductase [Amniculicola lignicola CBS 123094]|uniref:GMC oxidoreductase n=1 Tax=Amniculicola lignicola CBS 123094 TaxID=1392246 RepID=A0A6A5W1D2_9PLEO|nr:GMC oxidoreductase [Amniculicola lignicola CBS 123094]
MVHLQSLLLSTFSPFILSQFLPETSNIPCSTAMRIRTLLLQAQFVICGSTAPSLNGAWDYIIVGSGASGIPLADRLSESGKSVLLIERGEPSSGRWGGMRRPTWLEGTNLTRFDVPSLYQSVWAAEEGINNTGIFCPDIEAPASCVLGGGTAINAGQFYKPHPRDWSTMPPGWRHSDMKSATRKAFTRLPSTTTPSKDGKSYLTNGTNIALAALTDPSLSDPYQFISVNEHPELKNHTVALPEYYFSKGERHGPMSTYLVTASKRKNFRLLMNTTVQRALRIGGDIIGVQTDSSSGSAGHTGTILLTPRTGRLILSAGVFGTSKILFRSGIGPLDQLKAMQRSEDGPDMITEKYWIELPVGTRIDDAPAVYMAVKKADLETYPWEQIWYKNSTDKDVRKYLEKRSGPLAEVQPSIAPVFWDEVKGEDNRTRIIQWTVNSGSTKELGTVLLFASTLSTGKTSRGTLSLTPDLKLTVTKRPYFNDPGAHDFAALLSSARSLLPILTNIPNATLLFPPSSDPQELEKYLRETIATSPTLSSNHWTSSTYMAASCTDPLAVLDASTTVCGTTNLHIVDAGIVNSVPAANPQAVFVVAAERAAEIILGLG